MRLTILWIAFSVLALISGFLLVLVFCHVLIVPFMETEDYVTTTCLVSHIQLVTNPRGETCATDSRITNQLDRSQNCYGELNDLPNKDLSHLTLESNDIGGSTSCIMVTVLYRGVDGFPHQSILNLKPSSMYEDTETYLQYSQVGGINFQWHRRVNQRN